MHRTDPRPYPLSSNQRLAMARTLDTLRAVRLEGTRQQHGIGPGTPLTPAMARDIRAAEAAIRRVLDRDRRHPHSPLRWNVED